MMGIMYERLGFLGCARNEKLGGRRVAEGRRFGGSRGPLGSGSGAGMTDGGQNDGKGEGVLVGELAHSRGVVKLRLRPLCR